MAPRRIVTSAFSGEAFTRKQSGGVNELADESSWMQKSGRREYLRLMRLLLVLLRGIFGNRLTSLIFRTENFLSAGEVTKRCDLCWKEEESRVQKFLTLEPFYEPSQFAIQALLYHC